MDDMMKPWGFELEEYIREGEPDKAAALMLGELPSDFRQSMASNLLFFL